MSTRAFVLVSEFPRRYVVYYRHCDGYPTGLGLELIRAVQSGVVKPEELAEQLDLEEYFRWVTDPTAAFLALQADIEWVYEVCIDPPRTCIKIYKTSVPKDLPEFLFPVWSSYVRFLPEDIEAEMNFVEGTATIALNAVAGFATVIAKIDKNSFS